MEVEGLHRSTWDPKNPRSDPRPERVRVQNFYECLGHGSGSVLAGSGLGVIKINVLFPNGPDKTRILLNFPGCVAYLCVHVKFIFEKRT